MPFKRTETAVVFGGAPVQLADGFAWTPGRDTVLILGVNGEAERVAVSQTNKLVWPIPAHMQMRGVNVSVGGNDDVPAVYNLGPGTVWQFEIFCRVKTPQEGNGILFTNDNYVPPWVKPEERKIDVPFVKMKSGPRTPDALQDAVSAKMAPYTVSINSSRTEMHFSLLRNGLYNATIFVYCEKWLESDRFVLQPMNKDMKAVYVNPSTVRRLVKMCPANFKDIGEEKDIDAIVDELMAD